MKSVKENKDKSPKLREEKKTFSKKAEFSYGSLLGKR